LVVFSIVSSLTDINCTRAASAFRTTNSATPSPMRIAAAIAACCDCRMAIVLRNTRLSQQT
jgi:hypothetical protein